jgi:hypothetical protein
LAVNRRSATMTQTPMMMIPVTRKGEAGNSGRGDVVGDAVISNVGVLTGIVFVGSGVGLGVAAGWMMSF